MTDDIYEHIVYAGEHIPIATLPGMAERTVAVNSLSKTYSVTGWRVGWVIAGRAADERHPQGPRLPDRRRRRTAPGGRHGRARPARCVLRDARGRLPAHGATLCCRRWRPPACVPCVPDGAYYVMVDITGVTDEDDVTFARRVTASPGVASVPGSSFYSRPELGRTKVRFAFPKREATLAEAARRLATLA